MKTLLTDLVTLSKAKGLYPRLGDRPVREILHFVQDDKATVKAGD